MPELSIKHNGRTYYGDEAYLEAAGVAQASIDTAVNRHVTADYMSKLDEVADKAFTASASRTARYMAKETEARAFKAAGYSGDGTDYPTLAAEAPARGLSKQELADLIITKADAWRTFGANAEAARASLQAAVSSADGCEAKCQAAKAVVDGLKAQAATLAN
ncbi:hypothetical protein [Flexibacterium corallicola]|uniref:hypothetical protein n=1 Tax=Flexibacterium corallicola TaxID=3037259 RepID=UPI00286EC90C|nr:hypothetical protein [Pseudovibrio sp. M1P-2-3]